MKQKNSKPQVTYDGPHKKGNPKCSKSETIARPDARKKGGSGNVKNIH